jgi:integrase
MEVSVRAVARLRTVHGHTGLRPEEAARLEFRDVKIVKDHGSEQTILEIEVRGKRGVGWCKSTSSAVLPFKRLKDPPRFNINTADPAASAEQTRTDGSVIPHQAARAAEHHPWHESLKKDRDGNIRTAYSLRHTYMLPAQGRRRHLPDRKELRCER